MAPVCQGGVLAKSYRSKQVARYLFEANYAHWQAGAVIFDDSYPDGQEVGLLDACPAQSKQYRLVRSRRNL